ncbi:hypothetical protein H2248_002932 [Termitomyces sp. 'cryptogamus']|nr:hypothetical protein H2248_002932 [Termitomyces sp. 'cryptogamus']
MTSDHSKSLGREVYQSSGRGGAGNIRQASDSRDSRPVDGPDDFSVSRGRELVPTHMKNFYTGRGGAGNIRSPSRDPTVPTVVEPVIIEERELIRAHNAASSDGPFSSGRGGAGNIVQTSSRSRSRDPTYIHSTGRGGAGNILSGTAGDSYVGELKENVERKVHAHDSDLHSTGRGGLANITATPDPPVEHSRHTHVPGGYISSGRGGAGNIAKDVS